jgi:hypothetical protein
MARPAGFSEQVDRNRQASAMYAAMDGGSVPDHLQQYLPGGAAYDPSRGGRFDSVFQPVANALNRAVTPIAGALNRGMTPVVGAINRTMQPIAQGASDFMVRAGLDVPSEFRGPRDAPMLTPREGGPADQFMAPPVQAPQAATPGLGAAPGLSAAPGSDMSIEEIERRNRERSMVPEFRDGGRVGPGGVAFRPDGTIDHPLNTQGMDVPPAIQALLGTGDMPSAGLSQVQPTPMFSYEMGGQVGPGGMPMPMAGQQPGVVEQGQMTPQQQQILSPQNLEAEAQRVVSQNPEAVQMIQQSLQAAIQRGETTAQQIQMGVQMARVALENPDMYPQMRNMAIQQGLASEQELPQQYDPGFLFLFILAGDAMAAGGAQQPGMQQPMASMEEGGALPKESPNPDGSIPINAHEGEYVIPAEVVRAKGTDFFDKMIQSYREKGEQ